jgi:hypothetical protein
MAARHAATLAPPVASPAAAPHLDAGMQARVVIRDSMAAPEWWRALKKATAGFGAGDLNLRTAETGAHEPISTFH